MYSRESMMVRSADTTKTDANRFPVPPTLTMWLNTDPLKSTVKIEMMPQIDNPMALIQKLIRALCLTNASTPRTSSMRTEMENIGAIASSSELRIPIQTMRESEVWHETWHKLSKIRVRNNLAKVTNLRKVWPDESVRPASESNRYLYR